MNLNTYLRIVSFLVVVTLGAVASIAQDQSARSADGNDGYPLIRDRKFQRSLITAVPGQVTATEIMPESKRPILMLNSGTEVADFDFVAFGPDGEELARQTIEIEPGAFNMINVVDIFPELDVTLASAVRLQATVRPTSDGDDQTALRENPIAFFSQLDSRWSRERLGTCTGDTIGSSGCAITSIAMAAARSVYNMNPSSLNAWLTKNAGYSGGCLVVWSKAADVDGRAGFAYIGSGKVSSAANLKSIIDGNRMIVAKSARYSSHYVLIFGYKNSGASLSDFYYADPADKQFVKRYVGDGWVSTTSVTQIYQ